MGGALMREGSHPYMTGESSAASMSVPNATPHNKKCSAAIVVAARLGAHQPGLAIISGDKAGRSSTDVSAVMHHPAEHYCLGVLRHLAVRFRYAHVGIRRLLIEARQCLGMLLQVFSLPAIVITMCFILGELIFLLLCFRLHSFRRFFIVLSQCVMVRLGRGAANGACHVHGMRVDMRTGRQ